jgi:hypothetical protein
MELALARIEMLYIEKDSIHWEMFKNDCMEKEKEQIMTAFRRGLGTELSDLETSEQYYERIYNQNRIIISETKRSIEEIGK